MLITTDFCVTSLCVPITITPELKDVNGAKWSFESRSKQHFIQVDEEIDNTLMGELLLSDGKQGVFIITDPKDIRLYIESFCHNREES